MASRKDNQGLSRHPMLQRIIEALVSGQSVRRVASWVVPPVSHQSIQRYNQAKVLPVLHNSAELEKLLKPIRQSYDRANNEENEDFPPDVSPVTTAVTPVSPVSQQMKQKVIQALAGERILDAAGPMLRARDGRVAAKIERHKRLSMIVEGRSAEMSLCEVCHKPKDLHPWEDPDVPTSRCDVFVVVPGGESGFLARDYKGSETLTPVYKFDAPLLTAFEETEKAIAIELGQWQEQVAGQGVSIQIIVPTASAAAAGELPRVSYASRDQIEALKEEDEGISDIGLRQLPE